MSLFVIDHGEVASKVIAFAKSQEGKPYVWGAAGPDSYDCSGLVQSAFKSAGVDVPRTTAEQVMQGDVISNNDKGDGDLIFPHPGHVGIAVPSIGKVIHAPTFGDVVKEDDITKSYWANAWQIRRYATPGSGASGGNGGSGGSGDSPYQQFLNTLAAPFKAIGAALAVITNPHNWLRVAMVIMGGIGIALGIFILRNP